MRRTVWTSNDPVSAVGARRFVERFSRLLTRLGSKDRSLTVSPLHPFLTRTLCLLVALPCSSRAPSRFLVLGYKFPETLPQANLKIFMIIGVGGGRRRWRR